MKRTSSVLDSSHNSSDFPFRFKSLSFTEKKGDARCQERLGFINQRLNSLRNPGISEKMKEIHTIQNIPIQPEKAVITDTLPTTTTTTNHNSQANGNFSFTVLQSRIFNLSLSLGDAFTQKANISATSVSAQKPKPSFPVFESQPSFNTFSTQSYEQPQDLVVERKLVFTQEKENITSVVYKEDNEDKEEEEEKIDSDSDTSLNTNSNSVPIPLPVSSSKPKLNSNPNPQDSGMSSAKKKVVVKPYGPPKHKWTQKEVAILYELIEEYPIYRMKPADVADMAKELTFRFSKAGIKTVIKRGELIAKMKEELSKAQKKIDFKNEVYKGYNAYIHVNIADNDEAKD